MRHLPLLLLSLLLPATAMAELSLRVYHPMLQLLAAGEEALLFRGEVVEWVVTVQGPEGEPLADHRVVATSALGNPLEPSEARSDDSGVVSFSYRAEQLGNDRLRFASGEVYSEVALEVREQPVVRQGAGHVELFPLQDLPGVVSWQLLKQTRPALADQPPHFPDAVLALDGSEVTLQGYLLPLAVAARHEHFLLSASSPSCPFCLGVGPEQLVEVYMAESLEMTYEPVLVRGRFTILHDDAMGLLYRLDAGQRSER